MSKSAPSMSPRAGQPPQKAGCFEAAPRYESAKAHPFGDPPNASSKIITASKADCREDNDMAHFGPTRRSLLQGTLAASALSLTGFPARAEPQWKKYAGTTIEANLIKGPRGELLQKYASEFTDLTGIKVESEVIPEQQQRQKAVIELTSGKPSFDVIHVSYHVQKRQFEKAGWLADLTPFMKDPSLTAPDLTVNDFSAGGLQFAQNDKGEMAAAAEKLNDPANGIYGFTGRGLRNANMTLWTNFFLNYGGEFLDAKGNILTDGPAPIEDPNASRVVGKIGYALVPAGPKGQYSAAYGDGVGIPQASAKKEAAYLYCQWAVSKTMGARLLQSGGGVPFRNSVLNDETVRKGVKMPPEWLDSVIGSAKISKLGLPVIVPVAEFRDIVGAALTATLSGADPATELKKAHEQFRPILERSEKT